MSGGDGPARGLAAAAAPGHGLPRVVPAARTWPSCRGSLARPAPPRAVPSASFSPPPLGFVVPAVPPPLPPPSGSRPVGSSASPDGRPPADPPLRARARRPPLDPAPCARGSVLATRAGTGVGVRGGLGSCLAGSGACLPALPGDRGPTRASRGRLARGFRAGCSLQPSEFRALVPQMRKSGLTGHSPPPWCIEQSRCGRRWRNGQEGSLQGFGERVGEGHANRSPSRALWLNLGRGGAGWDWTIVEAGVGGGVRVDQRRFLVAL